jgi:hypothetical protein
MATVFEKFHTEEQRSVVSLSVGKTPQCKRYSKEIFPVYDGMCLSRKAIHSWVEKFSQGLSKIADDEKEVRNWLRQQSKDFYPAGFDALVKRWDKCISVDDGYVEE